MRRRKPEEADSAEIGRDISLKRSDFGLCKKGGQSIMHLVPSAYVDGHGNNASSMLGASRPQREATYISGLLYPDRPEACASRHTARRSPVYYFGGAGPIQASSPPPYISPATGCCDVVGWPINFASSSPDRRTFPFRPRDVIVIPPPPHDAGHLGDTGDTAAAAATGSG